MNADIDRVVWNVFEDSTIVRAIERLSHRLSAAAAESIALDRARSLRAVVAAAPGQVVIAAAVTHIALMMLIGRPVAWQWIMLPAIALVAGVVMIAAHRQPDR
jgi:hypothetical protein